MNKSYKKFNITIGRANEFIILQSNYNQFLHLRRRNRGLITAETIRNIRQSSDDLLRAAIVFAVSGMDAYFKDMFLEKLHPYVKKQSKFKEYAKVIEKYTDIDIELIVNLYHTKKRPNRVIVSMIRKKLFTTSMANLDSIDSLFLGLGIPDLTNNAARMTHKSTLLANIKTAINRRHNIVHYADCNPKGGSTKSIQIATIKRWIRYIEEFVDKANQIIDSSLS